MLFMVIKRYFQRLWQNHVHGDLDLMYETSKTAAIEASASGIHWTFAPMVDIARARDGVES